jgi:outer membrane protein assembly factor BamB
MDLQKQMSRRKFLQLSGGVLGLAILSRLSFGSRLPLREAAATSEETPFAFAVVGDSHLDPSTPKQSGHLSAILAELASEKWGKPEFLIHVGDIVESGLPEEYQEYERIVPEAWKPLIRAVPGNHETRWDETAKESFKLMFGKTHYSFDAGGIHFAALDPTSMLQEGGYFSAEQLRWLENDLKQAGSETPVVLYVHYPLGSHYQYVINTGDLFRAIEPYNVRAVFSGHIHRDAVWQQNGMTLFALPAVKNEATYYWVEKRSDPFGSSVLNVYRVEAGGSRKLLADIPLAGLAPARGEKPLEVKWSSPGGGEAALAVKLKPDAAAASVRFRLASDGEYAGSNNTAWQSMTLADRAEQLWQARVDVSGWVPGTHRLNVRVFSQSGAYWDEYADIWVEKISAQPRQPFKPKWERDLGASVQAGIAVSAKAGMAVVGTLNGKAAFLDLNRDGEISWEFQTQGAIIGTPAISPDGSRCCIGSANHRLYAFDIEKKALLWVYSGAGPAIGMPAWHQTGEQEAVYAAIGRSLVKLDGRTGAVLWSAGLNGFSAGKPACDGTRVFAGTGDGKFAAFDANTGSRLWQVAAVNRSKPYQTLLYSAWYSSPFLLTGLEGRELVLASTVSEAFALDRKTGAYVWRLKGGYMYSYPVMLPSGLLLMADEFGGIAGVRPETGEIMWSNKLKERLFNAYPLMDGTTVYLAGVGGRLTAVDGLTGAVLDEYRFTNDYVFSSPAAANGTLIIAGHDGKVRGFQI